MEPIKRLEDKIRRGGATVVARRDATMTTGRAGERMDFMREAKRYLGVTATQPAWMQQAAARLSTELTFGSDVSAFSCVPCHIDEPIDLDYIEAHVARLADHRGHTALLFNGVADSSDEQAWAKRSGEVTAALARVGLGEHVSVLSLPLQSKTTIGSIRWVLADALVRACVERGCADPVYISNDIDGLALGPDYGAAIEARFADNPLLDILIGPLHYGYDPDGRNYCDTSIATPELMLHNRMWDARRRMMELGTLCDFRYLQTEGPNAALRLSAYCAAGGYDSSLTSEEDDHLGISVYCMRTGGANPHAPTEHSTWDDRMWLATDPRRQLRTVVEGDSIKHTWDVVPFESVPGHTLSLSSLEQAYADNDVLIQPRDLHGPTADWAKVARRAQEVYRRYVDNEHFRDGELAYLSERYGVTGPGEPERETPWISKSLRMALERAALEPARSRIDGMREESLV